MAYSRPVLCYITSWSAYRPGTAAFSPANVNTDLCTHLVYAFATLDNHKLAIMNGESAGNYRKVTELREQNSDLKVLLAVGGASMGTQPFKDLTRNEKRIRDFAEDAIVFLRRYGFDGLDIDWEFPEAGDAQSFVNLLRVLRCAFANESSHRPRLLLTAAVAAIPGAGYNVPDMDRFVDYFNVMTYDFHGSWAKTVGHNSPLNASSSASDYHSTLTVAYSAKKWAAKGACKNRLLIGMPTYGRSFQLANTAQNYIGASALGPGTCGRFTKEAGILSYFEVVEFLENPNTTYVWDEEQEVPYAYCGNQWVGFDNARSFKRKMNWLKENGFGGAMVWTIDMDDWLNDRYPLLRALN